MNSSAASADQLTLALVAAVLATMSAIMVQALVLPYVARRQQRREKWEDDLAELSGLRVDLQHAVMRLRTAVLHVDGIMQLLEPMGFIGIDLEEVAQRKAQAGATADRFLAALGDADRVQQAAVDELRGIVGSMRKVLARLRRMRRSAPIWDELASDIHHLDKVAVLQPILIPEGGMRRSPEESEQLGELFDFAIASVYLQVDDLWESGRYPSRRFIRQKIDRWRQGQARVPDTTSAVASESAI